MRTLLRYLWRGRVYKMTMDQKKFLTCESVLDHYQIFDDRNLYDKVDSRLYLENKNLIKLHISYMLGVL